MKIRLKQSGFESYNGQMGVINFKDGLSTGDVLTQDAVRLSAVMLCEWEDGSTASVAQSILDNGNTPAPMFVSGAQGQHDIAGAVASVAKPAQADGNTNYTLDQLGAIADDKGIKGLREISDPLGIKSNSIKELIDAILSAGASPGVKE